MNKNYTGGFVLVTALTLVAILMIILATYSIVSINNSRTSASSGSGSAGFYAAEAALNARAEQTRQIFKGFRVPVGSAPTTSTPCQSGDIGSGDFACTSSTVAGRTVTSYVQAGEPQTITIPPGEDFENLNAEERPFSVRGEALGSSGNPEAITELVFRSRLVPLFQFAVFFGKDLEFSNTASLNLSGPVHTNGNLFLDAGSTATLYIRGQTTSASTIFRGVKHNSGCTPGTVRIDKTDNTPETIPCAGGRSEVTAATISALGGRLKRVPQLELPAVEQLQPQPGAQYWDKADVRIVLKRSGGTWIPSIVNANKTNITVTGAACVAAMGTSPAPGIPGFRDNREAQYWLSGGRDRNGVNDPSRVTRRMLEIDVRQLLTCLGVSSNASAAGLPAGLSDSSDGGLVIYVTVDDGPGGISQEGANNYAVRLRNGALLQSLVPTHARPQGITFVSDQAMFIEGNYNSAADRATGWIPAAVMADSMNVLSSNWANPTPCRARLYANTAGAPLTPYSMSRAVLANPRTFLVLNAANTAYVTRTSLAPWVFNPPAPDQQLGGTWYAYDNPAAAEIAPGGDTKSDLPLFCRQAAPTTINTAILSATASTGTLFTPTYQSGEGTLGREPQSGGVHNMMRFHEDWGSNNGLFTSPITAVPYFYRGSLVSLSEPLHAFGTFLLGENRYQPPARNWGFETLFTRAENLPPLTPRFVYLKQDNFTRQFER